MFNPLKPRSGMCWGALRVILYKGALCTFCLGTLCLSYVFPMIICPASAAIAMPNLIGRCLETVHSPNGEAVSYDYKYRQVAVVIAGKGLFSSVILFKF